MPKNPIECVLNAREKDLGGFSVRRALPTAKRKMVGPWIFFDEMGRAKFSAGTGINVLPHPHIGIATVTYLFEGEILHRDSLGNTQAIHPGDINLMVAGRGIVHSERERPEVKEVDHSLHGLQLWLALPEKDEETEPKFHHFSSSEIPSVEINNIPVRVMMGTIYGVKSPVPLFSETIYAEALLKAGQTLELPVAKELAVYVTDGAVSIGECKLSRHSMGILSNDAKAPIKALEDARIALIGGEPLGNRFIEWNFVSTDKTRIERAKKDWLEQRFPKVIGDDMEFIPFPSTT